MHLENLSTLWDSNQKDDVIMVTIGREAIVLCAVKYMSNALRHKQCMFGMPDPEPLKVFLMMHVLYRMFVLWNQCG